MKTVDTVDGYYTEFSIGDEYYILACDSDGLISHELKFIEEERYKEPILTAITYCSSILIDDEIEPMVKGLHLSSALSQVSYDYLKKDNYAMSRNLLYLSMQIKGSLVKVSRSSSIDEEGNVDI